MYLDDGQSLRVPKTHLNHISPNLPLLHRHASQLQTLVRFSTFSLNYHQKQSAEEPQGRLKKLYVAFNKSPQSLAPTVHQILKPHLPPQYSSAHQSCSLNNPKLTTACSCCTSRSYSDHQRYWKISILQPVRLWPTLIRNFAQVQWKSALKEWSYQANIKQHTPATWLSIWTSIYALNLSGDMVTLK